MNLDILRVVEFSGDEMTDIESLARKMGMTVNQYIVAAVHEKSSEIISKKSNS